MSAFVWTQQWCFRYHTLRHGLRWRNFSTELCRVDRFVESWNSIRLLLLLGLVIVESQTVLLLEHFLFVIEPKRLASFKTAIHLYATFSASVTLECGTSKLWSTLSNRRSFLITSSVSLFVFATCCCHCCTCWVLILVPSSDMAFINERPFDYWILCGSGSMTVTCTVMLIAVWCAFSVLTPSLCTSSMADLCIWTFCT